MLVLKGLVGLHRTIELQLLQRYTGWGIDLDYHDIEWFALETNRDHSVVRLHPSAAFWSLLLIKMATPFLLWDSCPQ